MGAAILLAADLPANKTPGIQFPQKRLCGAISGSNPGDVNMGIKFEK